jgi:DNA gyrase/topoisomerase IV subunit B
VCSSDLIWGGATRLRVDVDEAGWVTVEDDGLGIRDAPLPLESIFLRRGMVGRRLDVASPRFAIWWAGGPPLAVSCALSSRMEVESRRDGSVLRVAFECGRVVEPTVRVGDTTLHGLRVRYQADPVLFDAGSRLDLQLVERDLTTLAWLCPQLDVVLQGRSLQRGTGPAGWVQELAPDAVKETALTATGSAEEVAVEVSLAWAPGRTAPRLESFMNYAAAGGPEAGLLEALRAAAVQRGADPEHVVRGIVAVVHVGSHGSRDARKAVREVVARAIDATPWWWDRLNEVMPVTSPAVRGAP